MIFKHRNLRRDWMQLQDILCPVVNFINILRVHFTYKILVTKLQSCVLGLKFFGANISAKKCA